MKLRSVLRGLLSVCAALLLLALGWWTISGGLHDVGRSRTVGQQVETVIRLACGLLCIAAVVTRVRRHAAARPARIGFVVALAASAGLSALVRDPPHPLAALANGALALLVGSALVWALGPARVA